MASLDPVIAPAAFYAANLLFLAGALAVGWPVLRDGLQGLKGRPSADTMPALAACGALVQAAVPLLNAQSYQNSSWTLLSGVAALGLFLALLGSRVLLTAVRNGYDLAARSPEGLQGAFRVRDKDLIRVLARSLDQKDPWVLLSRPVQWDEALVEQSFGERASERRARKTALILLGAAVLSGLVFLLFGGGPNGMAAALTSMLCMGAPLSSTLVAGIASLRLQKTAAAAGAVVPGWAAIEELGGVDTVQVDADELFTADSVNLEDIRIFKGGRIDRAILYAASILNHSCETLRRIWRSTTALALPPGAITTGCSSATGCTWSGRGCPCLSRSTRMSTPKTARCRSCIWLFPEACTLCSCSIMWAAATPPAVWRCCSGRTSACWSPVRTPA